MDREARLAIAPNVYIDLLAAAVGQNVVLSGLFLRRLNERLALKLAGPPVLDKRTMEDAEVEPLPTPEVNAKALRIALTSPDAIQHTLFLPLEGQAGLEDSFVWQTTVSADRSEGSIRLCSLSKTTAQVRYRESLATNVLTELSVGEEPITLRVHGMTQFALNYRAESKFCIVSFTRLERDAAPCDITLRKEADTIELALASKGVAGLTLLVDILPIQTMIDGHTTATFRPGDLLCVIEGKVPITFGHIFYCALASANDRPVAFAPIDRPQVSQVRIALISAQKNMLEIVPSWEDSLFWDKPAIIAVGELTDLQYQYLAQRGSALGVAALTSATRKRALKAIARRADQLPGVRATTIENGSDLRQLEEFVADVLRDRIRVTGGRAAPAFEKHVIGRLPPLPYVSDDLSITALSLLGSVQRGRLPATVVENRPGIEAFAEDRLWATPWEFDRVTKPEDLIVELNLRLAAEYTACRAFVELFRAHYDVVGAPDPEFARDCTDADLSYAERFLRMLFKRWQRGLDRSTESSALDRVYARLRDAGFTDTDLFVFLAAAALAEFRELPARDQAHRLAHLNPLVVVIPPIVPNTYNESTHLEAGGWARFAARLSALKPGGIVLRPIAQEAHEELAAWQTKLRELLREGDTISPETIRELRTALGLVGQALLETTALRVLGQLGADRVVAFSDVLLDFVPWRGSILGLEEVLSRFPAGTATYPLQNAIGAANHLQTVERIGPRRATIVHYVPGNGSSDRISIWAAGLADTLCFKLKLLGFDATIATREITQTDQLLDVMESSRLLFFIGHGSASAQGAALDLGTHRLRIDRLVQRNWLGSLVFLIGCETSALDVSGADIGGMFLSKGASAVVGTTASVRRDVANIMVTKMVQMMLSNQLTADHAFLFARRYAVLYEFFLAAQEAGTLAQRQLEAEKLAEEAFAKSRITFSATLDELGFAWEDVYLAASYSLTFTLLGGVAESLV